MAEIYGSFGRVITGNTLGSSVASLARQILNDKISRIFNAYRDEVQYEGSLLDAGSAISKLTEMLGLVQAGSEAEKDIKEYIDAIRQEDRKRRANKAINKVDLAGAENKDYPELIKAIKGILADPTITETEKEAYKAALANQTRNYINNIMRQFNDGGSVTVDGKTVDFGMSANHSQLTSIIGGLMTDNPDMRMEIGKAFDQSRAMVMLKAAEFAFAENKDISNNGRAAAYEKLKKSTQEAYDLLAKSEFDLANSGVALDLLKDITKYSENIQDYKDAAASEYARDYVNKGNAKATSYFDAVDKFATQVLGNAKDAITGGTSLANLVLSGDIDAVYRYLDAVAANNKGNTGFTIDGKSYSISRDAFFDGIRTTRKIFNALDDFSSGNKNVHPDDQTYFSEAAGRYNVFIQGKEIFTIEDKYDAARDTMIKNIRSSGGDIYKIREAYIKFGQVLSGLASTYGPNSLVYDELMTESRLYVSGDVGKGDQLTYGVVSGNFDLGTEKYEDYLAEPLSAHDIAANTRRDLLETFVDFDGDKITIPRNLGPDSVLSYEGVKFARPSWAADGIKVKGLTGPNEVHQIIPIQDSLGKEKGWISFVNGKFIGGTRSNGKYTFYNSSDITRNLASLGITSPSDMELLFTDSGMVSNVNIAILGSKRELTLDQMEVRNGTWEDRVTGVQGENAGITPNKDEFDTYIKDLIDKKQIKLLPPAPSYAQQKTEDRILIKDDQGNWVAATALLDDSVVEQIMDRLPMITTPPGTDGDFGGTTRIPGLGGFGMGKGGTGTKPALTPDQQEAEYIRRGQMPSGGTRGTTLPTPPRVDPNRDLGYGEQVPITPPGGPSTGTSPVTGTTPVTGPSPITRPGPIKTTTAIKPIASLTSQAMVDFRAGERQSLTSTKSTAVGGFFRNSPFKISL